MRWLAPLHIIDAAPTPPASGSRALFCAAEGVDFDLTNTSYWSFPGALSAPDYNLTNMLSVASTAPNGALSYFSNYGASGERSAMCCCMLWWWRSWFEIASPPFSCPLSNNAAPCCRGECCSGPAGGPWVVHHLDLPLQRLRSAQVCVVWCVCHTGQSVWE